MASMVQCEEFGHSFDSSKYSRCPLCPIPEIVQNAGARSEGPQRSRATAGKDPAPRATGTKTEIVWPKPRGAAASPATGKGSPKSVGDPVVGWLVAIEGPAQGRDYRIRWGNNSIGTGENQRICISEDPQIHRDCHAVINFEPRSGRFYLLPVLTNIQNVYYQGQGGSGEGSAVFEKTELQAYDVIELGATRLIFVPLCGDKFEWL